VSFYRTEAAARHAGAALDALAGIDLICFLARYAADAADRAVSCAHGTFAALVRVDGIRQQSFADSGRAALFLDVRLILIAEILQCGQDRVRRRLAKAAERGILDLMAELLHLIQHVHRAFALGDLGQHLQQTLGADTAR